VGLDDRGVFHDRHARRRRARRRQPRDRSFTSSSRTTNSVIDARKKMILELLRGEAHTRRSQRSCR
jgi:hypothetical protein